MNNDTLGNIALTPLETYEWDSVWWEHADTEGVPRILYVGDSISRDTRKAVVRMGVTELYVDGVATSKAVDNPYIKDLIRMFAAQEKPIQAVLFSNALHGWHLTDDGEYKQGYEAMIQFFLETFKGVPLMLILATHVMDPELNARVCARNRVVLEFAQKYNLPVIDFHTASYRCKEMLEDGIHFPKQEYTVLAKELLRRVSEELPGIVLPQEVFE